MSSDSVMGVILGFILAVVAAYIYDRTGLKNKAALGNKKRAAKRIAQLQSDLDLVERYNADKTALNGFLAARILLAVTIYLLHEVIFFTWELVGTGSDNFFLFNAVLNPIDPRQLPPVSGPISVPLFNQFTDVIAAILNLVSVGLLMWAFRTAHRGYTVWRRVSSVDTFRASVAATIGELKASIGADQAPAEGGAEPPPGGTPHAA